jgi:hypothetical protein
MQPATGGAVMDSESAERWEIDQDELGNPLVRHRHPSVTVSAHTVKDVDGRHKARCPACGDVLEIPSPPGND